ncbi:hypothetical protein [Streptomyces sp. NPDC051677]|uniref:hypothetical protein n=1 Tax=Streptomyces sp. NPDC051677 TaxID=3365669 RepID=UPI0037D36567
MSREIFRSIKGFDRARERYPRVSVPVTLVYSENDWSRPAERDRVANALADVHRIRISSFSSVTPGASPPSISAWATQRHNDFCLP